MKTVEDILRKLGPALSSTVVAELEAAGISRAAARQRISRSNATPLGGIRFPHNQSFLYLDGQDGTDTFREQLEAALLSTNSAYGVALEAIRALDDAVPEAQFARASGSPARNMRGQLGAATVLGRLFDLGLLERNSLGNQSYITMPGADRADLIRARSRAIAERILIQGVRAWVRNMGLGSYNKVAIRGDDPEPGVGQFDWDLSAPSYIAPLAQFSANARPNPGFLGIDVMLPNRDIPLGGVRAFLRKCAGIRSQRGMRPFLGILLGGWFSEEALREGRSKGAMLVTPDTLFGSGVGKGLSRLIAVLSNAAAIAVEKPEAIEGLLSSLGRIEGAASNLRGTLFEMIVGHCVQKLEGGSIDIGTEITDPTNDRKAEIDVFRVKANEVVGYECRGHAPGHVTSRTAVETWLTERVPRVWNWIAHQDRFKGLPVRFEYWATGSFDADAIQYLRERSSKTKKYGIAWKDGNGIQRYAREVRSPHIRRVLNEHYFQHPLASTAGQSNSGR